MLIHALILMEVRNSYNLNAVWRSLSIINSTRSNHRPYQNYYTLVLQNHKIKPFAHNNFHQILLITPKE